MSFYDNKHASRLMTARGELIEVNDKGEMQMVSAHGHFGERFVDIHRVQDFGLSATPPAGAHGLLHAVGGRRDQMVVIGMEHPEHRPRNLEPGETVIYNAHGDAVSVIKSNIRIKSARVDINPP